VEKNTDYATLFPAKTVDTDQWARTAKEAGMGYILFLTKHHDGFCLWDTKTTERKVTNAPLKRDVLAELKKSCDKYGIKLALYFSEGEWGWPLPSPDTPKELLPDGVGSRKGGGFNAELKKAQLKELLTQYGPIEYIWFDHAVSNGGLSHKETTEWVKKFQPGCFVGYNIGAQAAADIRLGEMGKPSTLEDETGAPYQKKDADGIKPNYLLAEFTYPILPSHNGGAVWFYSLPIHDQLVRPVKKIYEDYLGAVKYGNIFSLDVGPDYEGKLREIDVKTLREVGRMIREKVVLPQALSEGKKIVASSVWNEEGTYAANRANDGDNNSRWGAATDSRSGWLEIDLGAPAKVSYAVIDESSFRRTTEFAIDWLDGKTWKTVAQGNSLGAEKRIDFKEPVTAAQFRLRIISASDVPTINEFQLYP
jgi:alpha-L-fucosidase